MGGRQRKPDLDECLFCRLVNVGPVSVLTMDVPIKCYRDNIRSNKSWCWASFYRARLGKDI